MAGRWAGFTEEELDKIRRGLNDSKGSRSVPAVKGGRGRRERLFQSWSADMALPVPAEALLSQQKEIPQDKSDCTAPSSPSRTVKLKIVDGNSFEILNGGNAAIMSNSSSPSSSSQTSPVGSKEDVSSSSEATSSYNNSGSLIVNQAAFEREGVDQQVAVVEDKTVACRDREVSKLVEFQQRQKYIEEQNRKKKELLARAIADRKKRTQAETKKLHQIQEELQKLDNLLSSDVAILRDQIETASLDFLEAQKRYDRAEKEFVEAKLQLFGKLEKKELLTEHLCTIIEQNEMRKARKLSELMEKLEMVDDHVEVDMEPVLPQLALLDDVGYLASTTLKPPGKCQQQSGNSPETRRGVELESIRSGQVEGANVERDVPPSTVPAPPSTSADCCLVADQAVVGQASSHKVCHVTAFHTKEAGEDGTIGVQI